MTDEKLLADWYEARGKLPRLAPFVEKTILQALRNWYIARQNLPPLEFCTTCQCKARGAHRKAIAA